MHSLRINLDGSVGYLTHLIFSMSPDLQRHSVRVAYYAEVLYQKALELQYRDNGELLPEKWLSYIGRAVLYHDLGKLTIPSQILNKEGPLDENEWAIMRQHPCKGIPLLDGVPFLTGISEEKNLHLAHDDFYKIAKDAILGHHERWDGKGYPYGLKGYDIPVIARICAIADAYDAITAERAYKPALPHEKAFALMKAGAGEQFEPELILVLNQCHLALKATFNDLTFDSWIQKIQEQNSYNLLHHATSKMAGEFDTKNYSLGT